MIATGCFSGTEPRVFRVEVAVVEEQAVLDRRGSASATARPALQSSIFTLHSNLKMKIMIIHCRRLA